MQILSFKLIYLGFRVSNGGGCQALADVRSSNSKTRELENKAGEGRQDQAERLPSTPPTGTCVSSWRAKNHRQLPVSCRVSFSCHSFCVGLKKGGSATLGSLGSVGPAVKCQLAGFISIAPHGRPFLSSRLLGKRLPQRYRPRL